MVDTLYRGGRDIAHQQQHVDDGNCDFAAVFSKTFDADLLAADLAPPIYDDVNQQYEEYATALAQDSPPPTPPALSAGPSPTESCVDSATAATARDPFSQLPVPSGCDVHMRDDDHALGHHFGFDDLIDPTAYDVPTAVNHDPLMPPPRLPHAQRHTPNVVWTPPACSTGLSPGLSDACVESSVVQPNELSRSLSKRGRTDTSNTLGGLKKQSSKRHKQAKDAYPCEQCDEKFDRACDKNKHLQRAHAPKDSLPHSCWECEHEGKVKRFLYPKDVRRHLKQVHNIFTNFAPAGSKSASPTSTKSPKTFGLWALCKTLVGLKKLRISATSPNPKEPEKFIMVSTDQRAFVDVDVSGITTVDALTARIWTTLDPNSNGSTGASPALHARTWDRQLGGRIQLGPPLDASAILHLVSKEASSQASLRFIVARPTPVVGSLG